MNGPAGDDILDGLNDDQLAAVTHESGPLLILAGAGSGKTRVITRRIAWLVRHRAVYPSRIFAVTFTNKAAGEMRERVVHLMGGGDAPRWMGTFHSLCLRLLRIHAAKLGFPGDFVVYDDDDSEAALKRVLKDLDLPKEGLRNFGSFIDRLKNDGIVDPGTARTPREEANFAVYRAYQEELRRARAMDFGDLLCQALRLLREHADVREHLAGTFQHVLVDEFQDTNLAQYEFLQLLVGPERNLCVVGDDDQSIYSWRGAKVENILEFQRVYPEARVVTLRSNYRSRTPILDAASRVITFNRKRHSKDLLAVRGAGEPVRVHGALNEQGEAAFVVREVTRYQASGVPLSNMAVFFRTNAQTRVMEDALRARRIPYRVVGGVRFYQRKEIKDVLCYLRLLVNPGDSVSLERIVNVPARGIGPTTVEKARAVASEAVARGEELPLLNALAQVGDESGPVAKRKIRDFVDMVVDLALMARDATAQETLKATLERAGYMEFLARDESPEGDARLANVQELLNSVREFEESSQQKDLRTYLDRVALVQPLDDDPGADAVTLMTVHAAKGLEFDCVWVCGLEDGLFPLRSLRSARDRITYVDPVKEQAQMEEERRLMYVAMTRARDHLYLTYAGTRMRYGEITMNRPSIFLSELPRGEYKVL